MKDKNEIAYYSRQILLNEIGVLGQQKLKDSKVLVIGAGGLGCPVLQYIAAAGVGFIGVMDGDRVEISNLHRQILFTVDSLHKNKAEEASQKLEFLNPFINVKSYNLFLDHENAVDILNPYDIVVDCSDNYETRYLVNDACVLLNKPLVYGSIYHFEGQVSVFNFQNGPTYRCLYPELPTKESSTNCSISGVLGILPGIIGIMQANEVIKMITGIGEVLAGKIMHYNALTNKIVFFELLKNIDIPYTNILQEGTLHSDNYERMCSTKETESFDKYLEGDYFFLDVRNEHELPIFHDESVLQIALSDLPDMFHQIPQSKKIVVFCKSGGRSKMAIELLEGQFGFSGLENFENGISEQFIEKWNKRKK